MDMGRSVPGFSATSDRSRTYVSLQKSQRKPIPATLRSRTELTERFEQFSPWTPQLRMFLPSPTAMQQRTAERSTNNGSLTADRRKAPLFRWGG